MFRRGVHRAAASLLAVSMAVGVASCSVPAPVDTRPVIGIALPGSKAAESDQAAALRAPLTAAGYRVAVRYGGDDIPTQVTQVEKLVASGVVALIVDPIDGTTMAGALAPTTAAGVPVVAYRALHTNKDFNVGNYNYMHIVSIAGDGSLAEPGDAIQIPVSNTLRPKGLIVNKIK